MIAVRVLRPFRAGGDVFLPGAIVRLDPVDALAVVGVRAELIDPLDREVIKAAVQETNQAALAAERRRVSLDRPWR